MRRSTPPPDITIRVRCDGQLHTIRCHRGRLQFFGHRSLAGLKLAGIIGQRLRCYVILRTVADVKEQRSAHPFTALPWKLRDRLLAQLTWRRRHLRGTGITTDALASLQRQTLRRTALERLYTSSITSLTSAGLKVVIDTSPGNRPGIASIQAWPGGPPLAVRAGGAWTLDFQAIEDASLKTLGSDADPFWGDGNTCRVCRRSYSVTHWYPMGMSDHANTRKHRHAITAAFIAALSPQHTLSDNQAHVI